MEGKYANNRLAFWICGEEDPKIADATINVPGQSLEEDEIIVRNYSGCETMPECLLETNLFLDTGRAIKLEYETHSLELPIFKYTGGQ